MKILSRYVLKEFLRFFLLTLAAFVVFCAASGILFGAIRVLGHRYFPETLFDRDVEIIRLHLTD